MLIQVLFKFCGKHSGTGSTKLFRQLNILRSASNISYRHNVGANPLIYQTVGETLTKAAQKYGDKECVVSMHEGQKYSFKEIDKMVSSLAGGLLDTGLSKGDRLGICAPNYIYWYLTFLAAARVGIILVTLNPAYQAPELEYCIKKVGMKGIIVPERFLTQDFYRMLVNIAPELLTSAPGLMKSKNLPTLTSVIIAGNYIHLPGCYMLSELEPSKSADKVEDIAETVQADDGFNIQFTSGTTGLPKAVLMNHFSVVNNSLNASRRIYNENDRICLQVPFFHSFGINTVVGGLLQGYCLVLENSRFNSKESLCTIEKEKCTALQGTPTMYVDLTKNQKEVNADLSSLRKALVAGAPCSTELYGKIAEELQVKQIFLAYGMTELSGVTFMSVPNEPMELTTNSVGYLMDHTEVKVVDNKGKILPLGATGQLAVKYYGTMLKYFGDEDKTSEVFSQDMWLKTGDLFVLRENGYGQIVGRIKEMILRGGENINPREIEELLNTHPDVVESQVVGVTDLRMGEEIVAFVVTKNDKFRIQDLLDFCKGKISHFKIPKKVLIIDQIPKTPSGKVQKFKLRALAENYVLIEK